jgi:hypothetical protein
MAVAEEEAVQQWWWWHRDGGDENALWFTFPIFLSSDEPNFQQWVPLNAMVIQQYINVQYSKFRCTAVQSNVRQYM